MKPRAFLLAGTAALLAAPAAAQVSDFRLQPAPTPTPQVVGPPPETPAPRATPKPSPSPVPTIAAPVPTPTPTPRIALPAVASPPPTTSERVAAPGPSPQPTATASVPPASPGAAATLSNPPALPGAATAPGPAANTPAFPAAAAPDHPARSWWPWIVGAFLLGGAGFAALWWLRRRIGPVGPLIVPQIERPRVPRAPDPAREPRPESVTDAPRLARPPAAPAEEAHPLHIAIELRKLSLTLMNATLGYRLTLTNAGAEPLAGIAVAADLIGAHASLPRELQLVGPDSELPLRHLVAGLAPGESGDVTGELRVPLNELRPIAQGRAQLFVPLARFRIGADGQEPRCFTLVAGQPSPSGNGAIQPVRLDLGPRIYGGLAGRAF